MTVSNTEVPGATVPRELEVVAVVVEATTWKHSLTLVVDEEARKFDVSGV